MPVLFSTGMSGDWTGKDDRSRAGSGVDVLRAGEVQHLEQILDRKRLKFVLDESYNTV